MPPKDVADVLTELRARKNQEKNLKKLTDMFRQGTPEMLNSAVDLGLLEVIEKLSKSRSEKLRELDFELIVEMNSLFRRGLYCRERNVYYIEILTPKIVKISDRTLVDIIKTEHQILCENLKGKSSFGVGNVLDDLFEIFFGYRCIWPTIKSKRDLIDLLRVIKDIYIIFYVNIMGSFDTMKSCCFPYLKTDHKISSLDDVLDIFQLHPQIEKFFKNNISFESILFECNPNTSLLSAIQKESVLCGHPDFLEEDNFSISDNSINRLYEMMNTDCSIYCRWSLEVLRAIINMGFGNKLKDNDAPKTLSEIFKKNPTWFSEIVGVLKEYAENVDAFEVAENVFSDPKFLKWVVEQDEVACKNSRALIGLSETLVNKGAGGAVINSGILVHLAKKFKNYPKKGRCIEFIELLNDIRKNGWETKTTEIIMKYELLPIIVEDAEKFLKQNGAILGLPNSLEILESLSKNGYWKNIENYGIVEKLEYLLDGECYHRIYEFRISFILPFLASITKKPEVSRRIVDSQIPEKLLNFLGCFDDRYNREIIDIIGGLFSRKKVKKSALQKIIEKLKDLFISDKISFGWLLRIAILYPRLLIEKDAYGKSILKILVEDLDVYNKYKKTLSLLYALSRTEDARKEMIEFGAIERLRKFIGNREEIVIFTPLNPKFLRRLKRRGKLSNRIFATRRTDVDTISKKLIKILEKEEKSMKKIYGYRSSDIIEYLGAINFAGKKTKTYAKYIRKAMKDISLPTDTAILFTDEVAHPYDMAEIAPGNEVINGKETDVFAIFIHEFSVGTLKSICRELPFFFPEFEEDDIEEFVVAFLKKIIWHELGHRKAWIEGGLFENEDDRRKGKLRETEMEAEEYAYKMIEKKYGKKFLRKFRIYNYAVAKDMEMYDEC